ncbi:lipase [Anaeramoeba flamelloides]|uniref:Lipase n=1 Tax=Anaeramoeba flamelloides TaxID=1746091 RepID=A0AAV8A6E0_9EUKA|nr:lipase [Anaeramoeba flamelloides]KAJ6243593.1 lipase [Anaeramoeba flamelloides]|eukprot:Anaeramoba_flamelloidesa1055168_253.p1 GENE.a1055168_253~~a1055168_253.p1  ORF type:complete len:417 (+),score=91.78 a1055168_253:19-1269(+)
MKPSFLFLIFLTLPFFLYAQETPKRVQAISPLKQDPDTNLNVSQIIRRHGYPCTEVDVVTEDGYILTMQHVPYGKNNPLRDPKEKRPPVLLQHGLLDSSFTWWSNYPHESLGYILADAGYDVWTSNVRGNVMGLRHKTLTPKDHKFWEFTFDEMQIYDLPANIDFVRKFTGFQKIGYVGHSQGGCIMLAHLSSKPELKEKLTTFVGLGAASYEGNQHCVFINLLNDLKLPFFLELFGQNNFMPDTDIIKIIAKSLCADDPIVCEDFIFLVVGANPGSLNQTRLPVFLTHTPAGTSTRNIQHWCQEVKSGHFQMYDYGSDFENWVHYNQTSPPIYDPSKIEGPSLNLYFGSVDLLVDEVDFKHLKSDLNPDLIESWEVITGYDHLDYVWNVNAHKYLYKKVVADLNRHISFEPIKEK